MDHVTKSRKYLCKMSNFVHSREVGSQNLVKFGPHSCWMTASNWFLPFRKKTLHISRVGCTFTNDINSNVFCQIIFNEVCCGKLSPLQQTKIITSEILNFWTRNFSCSILMFKTLYLFSMYCHVLSLFGFSYIWNEIAKLLSFRILV